MARTRMVTRTIAQINYQVLCIDTNTMAVQTETVTLASGDMMTDKVRESLIKAKLPENLTFVKVMSETKTEKLYRMTEEKFLLNAEEVYEG